MKVLEIDGALGGQHTVIWFQQCLRTSSNVSEDWGPRGVNCLQLRTIGLIQLEQILPELHLNVFRPLL